MKARSMNFLSYFDILGIKPQLYIMGKTHSSTTFGKFLSFLLFFFTGLCFYYFGQDFFNNTNPQIVYSEYYDPYPEKVIINPEITPFMIEFNSPNADEFFTDHTMFTAKVSQITINKTNPNNTIMDQKDYYLEICNESHFNKTDSVSRKYFLSKQLNHYFCIPKHVKNLSLEGAFDQTYYATVSFSFEICRNETNNNKCKSFEEIENKMSRGFIGIYFQDFTIDPGNFKEFEKVSPKEVFTNFVLNYQKEVDILFKNNYIDTDDGLFLDEVKKTKCINYDSFKEYNFLKYDPNFFYIYIKLEQKNANYQRTYIKLHDLVSKVGGFINFFWILAFGINFLFANLAFVRDIVKDIFTIRAVSSQTLKSLELQNNRSVKPFKTNNSTQKFLNSKNEENLNSNHDILSKTPKNIPIINKNELIYNKETNKRDSKFDKNSKEININHKDTNNLNEQNVILDLRIGICDFLHYYLGIFKNPERDQKKAIIKKGLEILENNLDVKYVIQKFYEVEKLKFFLLDEKQREEFDAIPKPELQLNVKKNGFDVLTKLFRKKSNIKYKSIK